MSVVVASPGTDCIELVIGTVVVGDAESVRCAAVIVAAANRSSSRVGLRIAIILEYCGCSVNEELLAATLERSGARRGALLVRNGVAKKV